MEEVRVFKILFGGIWEEGPPHSFPTRIFRPMRGEWEYAGMSEFLTYKYVGGKSLESRVPWDGDTTSIFELSEWVQKGVPEFVNNLVRINWLWGKQRYEITGDVDLIYFWHHAPKNVDGFTEIIIDTEPVIPLAFDATNVTDTMGKGTIYEDIIDLTVGDADGEARQKSFSGFESSGDHGQSTDSRDADGEARQKSFSGFESSPNNVESVGDGNLDGQGREKAFSGVESSPNHGESTDSRDADAEELRNECRTDEQHDEHVTVQFLGKKFNLDQLDAEDEEYMTADSSDEEIEPNEGDEVLKRTAAKTPQEQEPRVDGEGPSSRVDGEGPSSRVDGEDEDVDFIRKTDMLEEDDYMAGNEHGLQLEVNQSWSDVTPQSPMEDVTPQSQPTQP